MIKNLTFNSKKRLNKYEMARKPVRYLKTLKMKKASRGDILEILGFDVLKVAKSYKKLLDYPKEVLKERAENLTKIFGHTRWKSQPLLLTLAKETAQERAEILDKIFGPDWRRKHGLLYFPSTRIKKDYNY